MDGSTCIKQTKNRNSRWCEDDVNNKFDWWCEDDVNNKRLIGDVKMTSITSLIFQKVLLGVVQSTLQWNGTMDFGWSQWMPQHLLSLHEIILLVSKDPPKKWNGCLLLVNHWLLLIDPPHYTWHLYVFISGKCFILPSSIKSQSLGHSIHQYCEFMT